MPKSKKLSYSSHLLPDNVRIRGFEEKDYEEVRKIYANSMLENCQYVAFDVMQNRLMIFFWLGLTYLTMKNYSHTPAGLTLTMFAAWGVFLFINVRRFVTYYTKRAVHSELVNIPERYNNDGNAENDHPKNGRLARFWVAMDKDAGHRVVACLALDDEEDRQQHNTCVVDQIPRIKYLCVDKDYRRCGVSTALLEHALKFVNKRGGKRVLFSVPTWFEPAIDLFDSFGFREIGREKMFWGFVEGVKLQVDVEMWVLYRKLRKGCRLPLTQ